MKAWYLSMQLQLNLHVIPSSCEELSMASPFSYAPDGINELTLLSPSADFQWTETAVHQTNVAEVIGCLNAYNFTRDAPLLN